MGQSFMASSFSNKPKSSDCMVQNTSGYQDQGNLEAYVLQTCLGAKRQFSFLKKHTHRFSCTFKEFGLPWPFKKGKCKCASGLVDEEKQKEIEWAERKGKKGKSIY